MYRKIDKAHFKFYPYIYDKIESFKSEFFLNVPVIMYDQYDI